MRHYANLLKNNRGVTLVEVLAAFTISTLVLGIAYGLLLTGMKTYEKIGIEQSLRDEADYVVSRIMQTFYESDISDIRDCDSTPTPLPSSKTNICIEIVSAEATTISGANDKVRIANSNELKSSNKKITQIKVIEETNEDGKKVNNIVIEKYNAKRDSEDKIVIDASTESEKEQINSDKYDFIIDSTKIGGSEINATCSYSSSIIIDPKEKDTGKEKFFNKKCSNGIVDISLLIKRANVLNDKYKLELKSQFGF